MLDGVGIHSRRSSTPRRTQSPSVTRTATATSSILNAYVDAPGGRYDSTDASRTPSTLTTLSARPSTSRPQPLPRSQHQLVSPHAELHFARLQLAPRPDVLGDWSALWGRLFDGEAAQRRDIKSEWSSAIPFAFYGLECLRLFAFLEECSKVVGHTIDAQGYVQASVFARIKSSIADVAGRTLRQLQGAPLSPSARHQGNRHLSSSTRSILQSSAPADVPDTTAMATFASSPMGGLIDESDFYTERDEEGVWLATGAASLAGVVVSPDSPSLHVRHRDAVDKSGDQQTSCWKVLPAHTPFTYLEASRHPDLPHNAREALSQVAGPSPALEIFGEMHQILSTICKAAEECSQPEKNTNAARDRRHGLSSAPPPSVRDLFELCEKQISPAFPVAELLDHCFDSYHEVQAKDPQRQVILGNIATDILKGMEQIVMLVNSKFQEAVAHEKQRQHQTDTLANLLRDEIRCHAQTKLACGQVDDTVSEELSQWRDKSTYLQRQYEALAHLLNRSVVMLHMFDAMLTEASQIHYDEIRHRRALEYSGIWGAGGDLTSGDGDEASARIGIMLAERSALKAALLDENNRYWRALLEEERSEWKNKSINVGNDDGGEDKARKQKASDTEMRLLRAKIKDLEKQLKEATAAMVEAINDGLATEDSLREAHEEKQAAEVEAASTKINLQKKTSLCEELQRRAEAAEAEKDAMRSQLEEAAKGRQAADLRIAALERRCAELEADATITKGKTVEASTQCDAVGGRMRLVLRGESRCAAPDAFLGRRLEPVTTFGALGRSLTQQQDGVVATARSSAEFAATLRRVFSRLLTLHPLLRGLAIQTVLRWGSTEGVLPKQQIPSYVFHLSSLFAREGALPQVLAFAHGMLLQQLLQSFEATKPPLRDGDVGRGVVIVVDPFRMLLVELPTVLARNGSGPMYSYSTGRLQHHERNVVPSDSTLSATAVVKAFSSSAENEPRWSLASVPRAVAKLLAPTKKDGVVEGEFGTIVAEGSIVFDGSSSSSDGEVAGESEGKGDGGTANKYKSIRTAALVAEVCHRFADAGQRRQRRRERLNAHRERACGRTPRVHDLRFLLHVQRIHPDSMGCNGGRLGVVVTFGKSASLRFGDVCGAVGTPPFGQSGGANGEQPTASTSPSSDSEVDSPASPRSRKDSGGGSGSPLAAALANNNGTNKSGSYQRTFHFGCGRSRDAFLGLLHAVSSSSVVHIPPTQFHQSPSWLPAESPFPSVLRLSQVEKGAAVVIPASALGNSVAGWLHGGNKPTSVPRHFGGAGTTSVELVSMPPEGLRFEANLNAEFVAGSTLKPAQMVKCMNPTSRIGTWDVSPLADEGALTPTDGRDADFIPCVAAFGKSHAIGGSLRLPAAITSPLQTLKVQLAQISNRASYNKVASTPNDSVAGGVAEHGNNGSEKERPLVAHCDVFEFFDAENTGDDDNSIAALIGDAHGDLAKADGLFASPLTSFRLAKKDLASSPSSPRSMRFSPVSSPSLQRGSPSGGGRSQPGSPNTTTSRPTRRIVVYHLPSVPQPPPPPPPFASLTDPPASSQRATLLAVALGRHIPQCARDPNNPPEASVSTFEISRAGGSSTPSRRHKPPPAMAAHEARLQGECNCIVVDFTMSVQLRKWTTYRPSPDPVVSGGPLEETIVFETPSTVAGDSLSRGGGGGSDEGVMRHTDLSQLIKEELSQYVDPHAWTLLCHFSAETRQDHASDEQPSTTWVPAQQAFHRLQTVGAVPHKAHFSAVLVSSESAAAFTNVDCREVLAHIVPRCEVPPPAPLMGGPASGGPIVFSSFRFAEVPIAIICGGLSHLIDENEGSDFATGEQVGNDSRILLYEKSGAGGGGGRVSSPSLSHEATAAATTPPQLLFDSTVSATHTILCGSTKRHEVRVASNCPPAARKVTPRIVHLVALHPILELESDASFVEATSGVIEADMNYTGPSYSPVQAHHNFKRLVASMMRNRRDLPHPDDPSSFLLASSPLGPRCPIWHIDVISASLSSTNFESTNAQHGAAYRVVFKSSILSAGSVEVPSSSGMGVVGGRVSLSCCTSQLERVLLEPLYIALNNIDVDGDFIVSRRTPTMVTILDLLCQVSSKTSSSPTYAPPEGAIVSVPFAADVWLRAEGDCVLMCSLSMCLRFGPAC